MERSHMYSGITVTLRIPANSVANLAGIALVWLFGFRLGLAAIFHWLVRIRSFLGRQPSAREATVRDLVRIIGRSQSKDFNSSRVVI
jgi:hypothetical protein